MCKNKPIDSNFTSDIDLNSPKACISSNDMNFYTLSQVTDFVNFSQNLTKIHIHFKDVRLK